MEYLHVCVSRDGQVWAYTWICSGVCLIVQDCTVHESIKSSATLPARGCFWADQVSPSLPLRKFSCAPLSDRNKAKDQCRPTASSFSRLTLGALWSVVAQRKNAKRSRKTLFQPPCLICAAQAWKSSILFLSRKALSHILDSLGRKLSFLIFF